MAFLASAFTIGTDLYMASGAASAAAITAFQLGRDENIGNPAVLVHSLTCVALAGAFGALFGPYGTLAYLTTKAGQAYQNWTPAKALRDPRDQ